MADAIACSSARARSIVDPADIPSVVDADPASNFLLWNICRVRRHAKGSDADCSVVFKYGMKRDFNAWLRTLGPAAPVKTLTELREWNLAHAQRAARSSTASRSSTSPTRWTSRPTARATRPIGPRTSRSAARSGIDAVMKAHQLDALLFPGGERRRHRGPARLSDRDRAVRHGAATRRRRAFPTGFNAKPAPFGVSFTGMACSEPRLLELAYAFEQATKRRVPPF